MRTIEVESDIYLKGNFKIVSFGSGKDQQTFKIGEWNKKVQKEF